jgi:hypothetical protein
MTRGRPTPERFLSVGSTRSVSAEHDVSIINDLECCADEYFGDPDHIYSGSSMVTKQIYDHVASALSQRSLGG